MMSCKNIYRVDCSELGARLQGGKNHLYTFIGDFLPYQLTDTEHTSTPDSPRPD